MPEIKLDAGKRMDFMTAMREALDFAIHEGLRANTVIIDKGFAKTSQAFVSMACGNGRRGIVVPPMILGLEAQIAPLPDGVAFAVTELVQTNMDAVRENMRREMREEIRREVIEELQRILLGMEMGDGLP